MIKFLLTLVIFEILVFHSSINFFLSESSFITTVYISNPIFSEKPILYFFLLINPLKMN